MRLATSGRRAANQGRELTTPQHPQGRAGSSFNALSALGHDLPVGIGDLHASRCGDIGTGRGGCRSCAVDRAARGPAGNAGIAHRRQRASDPRLGDRDKPMFKVAPSVPKQGAGKGCGGEQKDKHLARREGHFFSPSVVPAGTSSNWIMTSESRLALVAPSGGLNVNASASVIASVFQSLMRSVYCGAPASVLLVITYLRGIGWAPLWIQICQSVSWPRNARCSHSTPSTTPWPTCSPSTTSDMNWSKELDVSKSVPGIAPPVLACMAATSSSMVPGASACT